MLVSQGTRCVQSGSQTSINLGLKTLEHCLAWQSFKLASLGFLNDSLHLPLVLPESFLDLTCSAALGNDVLDAYAESVLNEPVIDDVLSVG